MGNPEFALKWGGTLLSKSAPDYQHISEGLLLCPVLIRRVCPARWREPGDALLPSRAVTMSGPLPRSWSPLNPYQDLWGLGLLQDDRTVARHRSKTAWGAAWAPSSASHWGKDPTRPHPEPAALPQEQQAPRPQAFPAALRRSHP